MIDVQHLTKRYGSTLAVDGLTFAIQPGEVIGLLGPNGAGKTTLLKMLTGYLPPTDGTAKVLGMDTIEHPLALRERIGYLPETNPLYDELAVMESLQWTARLRGRSDNPATLEEVIHACGLERVVGRDISELSKGYRQRVGLAQAILHDPDLLILDEPTSGLDPNQQQEVRQLIQRLKQKKTVILSTHILAEAQTSCDRVLIIHRGRIVADGTPESLGRSAAGMGRLRIELKAPAGDAEHAVRMIEGVQAVRMERPGSDRVLLHLDSAPGIDVREALFALAVQRQWPILQLTPETASLEDVFRQLTTV